jgi:hypothetical protein
VIDETTGEGVPNAKIDLFYKRSSDSWFSSYEYIKSVTSDSKGYYSLTLDSVNVKGRYALKANQSNYFFDDGIVSIIENEGTNIGVDLKMQPTAYVNLHFKNIKPENWNDWITTNIGNIDLLGENVDRSFILKVKGNKIFEITCFVHKSSKGDYKLNYSTFCTKSDTSNIDIFY